MDRNLGAKDIDSDNTKFTGTKYQYGRKDPFPTTSTTYDLAGNRKSAILTVRNSAECNLLYSVKEPNVYSIKTSQPYDWCYYEHPYKNALWRNPDKWYSDINGKSLFDPCPVGWKLPQSSTFNGIAKIAAARFANTGCSLPLNGLDSSAGEVWFPYSSCWTNGSVYWENANITRYSNSHNWLLLSSSEVSVSSSFAVSGQSYGIAVAGTVRCIQEK